MPGDRVALERDFDGEMMQIYERAKREAGYTATRFLHMLHEHRGLETAKRLLPKMSEGFKQLWERGRLDLTVEHLMLHPRWQALFTDDERDVARQRLRGCGMDV